MLPRGPPKDDGRLQDMPPAHPWRDMGQAAGVLASLSEPLCFSHFGAASPWRLLLATQPAPPPGWTAGPDATKRLQPNALSGRNNDLSLRFVDLGCF